ncbi:MAG: gliding motility-associated C-terminal domain-containing protein [Bacteroidota bacterium]
MKKLLLAVFCCIGALMLTTQDASATHLMGGNMTYTYLGLNSGTGLYDYRVTLKIYRLCDPGSSQLPTSTSIGAYQDNPGNPSLKQRVAVATLNLISQQAIVPPNAGASCSFAPNVCVEEGIYQTTVSVPANTTGYYFIADRCCRNNNIANLSNPGATGEAYYAYAPAPSIINNSPTFAVPPVPFICANDTVSILNQAIDVDGDSLSYSFVTPFSGISSSGSPSPTAPTTYTWPIPTVAYATNFSNTQPFGLNSYASMNPTTGLGVYVSPNQGYYVVAVEISEYRNGVLIGLSRLDIQIIVINCPTNPAPTLSSSQTTYTIQEGQTLCFNVGYSDPNGDSLFITHTGDIFNSTLVNPTATLANASGDSTVSTQFCWTTSCNQGRSTPYQFSTSATDNGCPAKVTNTVYTINVINTQKPTVMNGPDTLCLNAATGIAYSVSSTSGYTYHWIVTNGTQVAGTNTASASVNFSSSGLATVSIVALNPFGCPSDTLTKTVYIKPQPAAVAGSDVSFCSGGQSTLGTSSTTGYSYSWSPATNLSSSTISNPVVTISNTSSTPTTTTYILTTTLNGCTNKDTVVVTANPYPVANAGNNVSICSGTSAPLGALSTSGYNYSWTPTNGLSNSAISNPVFTLTNTGNTPDTLHYVVLVSNNFTCSATDTVQIIVRPVPTAVAGIDTSFCSGGSGTIGSSNTSGYTYSWTPSNGLTSPTGSSSSVSLTNSTTANDTVNYILTTSWYGCTAKDTVKVIVKPVPTANAGSNLYLCSGVNGQLGTISTSGYNYIWTPATGLSNPNVSNPVVSLTNNGSTTDTVFYYLNTDLAGCQNNDTVRVVVAPIPTANAGVDQTYCSGQTVTIGSTTTSGYSYSWTPVTGLSTPTGSTSTVTLTNTTTANDTVSYILTTTWFGCTAKDTVKVIVKPVPTANAGSNLYLCSGVNGQLGTISTSGYNYSWTPSTGLSNPSISNPVVSLTNNGATTDTVFYYLNTDLAGCQNYDTVRVVVGPVPTANAGTSQTYCSGQSATIGSTSTSGYTYSWTPSTGLSSTTVSDPTSAATNSGNSPITITYSVITTWFGCKDTATVDVTIKPVPASVAGVNQLLCSGSTVQLGGTTTNGYTYTWSPGTNLSDSLISNPTLSDTTTALTPDTLFYSVTTELNGCTSSDTVQVVLSPVPTAQAGNDITFCSGQSGTIGDLSITNYNYSWSPSTGISGPTQSSTTVTLNNSTTAIETHNYILTTNLFGCLDHDTVAVNVKPLPISEAGTAISSCNGDTVSIGANATNGYTYVWTPNTALSSDTTSTTQVYISNTGTSASTIYYTVVTTLNGCTTSDSVAVTSNPLPIVTTQANPSAICIGQSTTVSASGASTYNWYDILSPGVAVGTGSALTVTPQTTTTYFVEGTSAANCISYDTITITVNPLPIVQILTASTNLCYGDTMTLTGSGATNYSWTELATGNSLGSTSSINVAPTSNTSYILNGIDGNSCANADTIDITVNPAPTVNGITGTLSVCPGATGVQYWVNNPNPSSSYNWIITNGTIASGQGGDTITIDWPGIQTPALVSVVEVTDKGCPSDTVMLPVNINVVLDPLAPTGANTLCANLAQGISYTTLNTPGSVYTWHAQGGTIISGDGTNNVVVDWNVAGPQIVALWYDENSTTIDTVCAGVSDTLYVTINPIPSTSAITGNNAICVGDSATYSVINTTGSTYSWNISGGTFNGISTSNSTTATMTTVPSAVVSVQETNNYGCIGTTVTYNVTVNALPNADAGTTATICSGTTTTLNASGGTSYAWTTNSTLDNLTISNPVASPTTTTTYYVLVTDANGCKKSDSVMVVVNQLPNVTASNSTAICIGSSTTITASGASNYVWTPTTGLSSSTIANPVANPTSTTTYSVVGTDNNGCSNSANTTITVNPLPIAVVSSGGVICNGGSIALTASGGSTYNWSPSTGLNNATIANPIASPTVNTTYTVIVTDANGCTDDDQVTINVNDQPIADFAIDSAVTVIGCQGVEITLINNSTNSLNYEWNFGDGNTTTDANPTHIYAFGSTINITLIAYNNQCSDTLVAPFGPGLLADYFNNVPNIFTPNNDGVNDCFNLGANTKFEDCTSWEIYNRWGTKVFTSSSAQTCWNGKKDNTGEDQPAGTYFYILKAGSNEFKGTVLLNR